jgi:dihydroorotate dehydrogenase electron transfer subunit
LLKNRAEMATTDRTAAVHATTVLERRELAPGVICLSLDSPRLADETRPGQYVMAIPPSAQTAATALAVYEAEGKRASLLFFVTGKRTRELAELRRGDRLDVVGPLGNGFQCMINVRDAAIVAGGVGIASVLLCARALIRNGVRVRLFYGARTAALLVETERFAEAGCELVLTTDDGSAGECGFVTGALERAPKPEAIYACGPTPMLRTVARIATERGIPAQLALEETFGCGIGGCWGCVVPIVRDSSQAPSFPPASSGGSDVVYARICREGPVFSAEELRW